MGIRVDENLIEFKFLLFIILFLFSRHAMGQAPSTQQELEPLLQQAIKAKDNGKAASYAYEIARLNHGAKAFDYLDQAVLYGKKSGDNALLYLVYQQTGLMCNEEKKYSKAVDAFQKALEVARVLKKSDLISTMLVESAQGYEKSGKVKKAIEPMEEAVSIARKQNDVILLQKYYPVLASYYSAIGNKDKAGENLALYNVLVQSKKREEEREQEREQERKALEQQVKKTTTENKSVNTQLTRQAERLKHTEDSLLTVKNSLESTEHSLTEAKDINERRQLEIDLLNKDKAFAALQIKEQQANLEYAALIRNFILVGTLLAVALIVVIVINYRKKVKDNKKIDLQNKSIKSSINYAKRIQEAMLPKPVQQDRLLPNSFILFKPRDSVSGDFYWFTEIKSWYSPDVVFAAADCTGHGVPGAFMSLIGMNALNGIITRGIAETDQILNALDSEIRTALQQETSGNNDGMDIALCIYRKEKNMLEFSGAKNPLIYIQDNELFQVKGDVHSIGGSKSKNGFVYKQQKINIEKSTMIYLFSDGYRDQFGGKDNMKFMSKKLNKLLLEIHHKPLAEQKEILDKTIVDWMGNYPQTDDILVMGILLDVETVA